MKTARHADALVEIIETGNDPLDHVADEIVVIGKRLPVDLGIAKRRLGDTGDDGDFRTQLIRGRRIDAAGTVHHAHGILHRDDLRAAGRIAVDFRSAETGQHE